jgi:hypothetical protein
MYYTIFILKVNDWYVTLVTYNPLPTMLYIELS